MMEQAADGERGQRAMEWTREVEKVGGDTAIKAKTVPARHGAAAVEKLAPTAGQR
jgi:hypothetical protein